MGLLGQKVRAAPNSYEPSGAWYKPDTCLGAIFSAALLAALMSRGLGPQGQ